MRGAGSEAEGIVVALNVTILDSSITRPCSISPLTLAGLVFSYRGLQAALMSDTTAEVSDGYSSVRMAPDCSTIRSPHPATKGGPEGGPRGRALRLCGSVASSICTTETRYNKKLIGCRRETARVTSSSC